MQRVAGVARQRITQEHPCSPSVVADQNERDELLHDRDSPAPSGTGRRDTPQARVRVPGPRRPLPAEPGNPRGAEGLIQRAYSLYRARLGADHRDTLAAANILASNLYAAGDYKQARTLYEDAVARYRRVLGEDHPDTLASANNLAVDLRALG